MIGAEPFIWTRELYDRITEFGLWNPEARIELVGGEIVQLAPQDPEHACTVVVAGELFRSVFGADFHTRTHCPLIIGPMSEPEPDIAVVQGDFRAYRKEHPATAALILEVARSSLLYDREVKASLYASAGVSEYWIVNLVDHQLEVHRDPAAIKSIRFGHGYRSRQTFHRGDVVHPVAKPDASIAVADLFE